MPTTAPSTDRIEKQITLDVPRSRVWRALTEVKQFNAWFGVSMATPFAPGAEVSGQISFRGEHLTMTIWIETMEPERFRATLFSMLGAKRAVNPARFRTPSATRQGSLAKRERCFIVRDT